MKTSFQSVYALLFAAVLYCSCTTKPDQRTLAVKGFTNDQMSKLDHYFANLQNDFSLPALAVVAIDNDHIYHYTHGIASEKGNAIDGRTPIFMGTISEPMVATAILKLASSGKLDLDDPIVKHLPYFKIRSPNYRNITIRHLLTHTSGIPRYGLTWENIAANGNALERTTKSIVSQAPRFSEPGSRVGRSAYNYDVLGDLIAKVSGQSFEAFMQSDVFGPLGMSDSDFRPPKLKAMPFRVKDWKSSAYEEESVYPYNPEHAGSNGFHSSLHDVSKWIWMLLHGSSDNNADLFLSEEHRAEALSIQRHTAADMGVGLGWEIVRENGKEYYVKKSHYAGFSSSIVLLPEAKRGVAFFTNITTDLESTVHLKSILQWLGGAELLRPKMPVTRALGKKFYEARDLDTTLRYYNALKKDSSDVYSFSPEALGAFGLQLLYKEKQYTSAIEVFKHVLSQFPRSAYAHIVLAEGYVSNGDVRQAKTYLARGKGLAGSMLFPQISLVEERIAILEEKMK